jgi:hypothetical protein
MISTLTKSSSDYANKRLGIKGEWKSFNFHRLVGKNILGRSIRTEYFGGQLCEVCNCINSKHLWEGSRLDNFQYSRLKKGRIKEVGSTSAPPPQKKQRGREISPGIRLQIQPTGGRICTWAKRSDGYAIKGIKIKGKTKSFYAHRLVLEQNWDDLLNQVILLATVATIAVVSILTICGKEPPPITPAML